MKGLLIKDVKYLMMQKRFFIVVLGFGFFLSITGENPLSCVGYITMLITIFTLSTISYDEYENGMSFLMTLPIHRNMYAMAKYIFAGGIAVLSAVISAIIAIIAGRILNISLIMKELLLTSSIMIIFSWLTLAVTIPMQIKYGVEKARIVLLVICGGVLGIGYLLSKGSAYLGIDLLSMVENFFSMNKVILLVIGVAVFVIVLLTSYAWSVCIMKKREF